MEQVPFQIKDDRTNNGLDLFFLPWNLTTAKLFDIRLFSFDKILDFHAQENRLKQMR